ncbi:putative Integral membrane protein PTH11 [Seiridium cardinale]
MSSLYSDAPPARAFSEIKPTLLISWWITLLCTVIILLRLVGRLIRVEKLFIEDKVAALAIVPLYIRAACVHVALTHGTNNVRLESLAVTDDVISQRATGSRAVLASRIFFAATLWTLKLATVLFFRRLAGSIQHKTYKVLLAGLYFVLGATFLAAVLSDLTECQPFPQYWQVESDPGGSCRQALVQLIIMGTCNALTDLLLVIFPIPIILSTKLPVGRKVLLILIFCFGLLPIAVTIYRVPAIIDANGDQLVRSMWASVELLCATIVANFVALGSFLRDSGVKKQKFKLDASNGRSRQQAWNKPDQQIPEKDKHDNIGIGVVLNKETDISSESLGGLRLSQGKTVWNQSEESLISQKLSRSTPI